MWARPFGSGCFGVRFAPVLRTKPFTSLAQTLIVNFLLIEFLVIVSIPI